MIKYYSLTDENGTQRLLPLSTHCLPTFEAMNADLVQSEEGSTALQDGCVTQVTVNILDPEGEREFFFTRNSVDKITKGINLLLSEPGPMGSAPVACVVETVPRTASESFDEAVTLICKRTGRSFKDVCDAIGELREQPVEQLSPKDENLWDELAETTGLHRDNVKQAAYTLQYNGLPQGVTEEQSDIIRARVAKYHKIMERETGRIPR